MGIEPMSEFWGSNSHLRSELRIWMQFLEAVKGKRTPNSYAIKLVDTQYFEISQFVPHTQLMVSLKFVPMAGSADALKIFPAVWIAGS